jgi:hypothetical protein
MVQRLQKSHLTGLFITFCFVFISSNFKAQLIVTGSETIVNTTTANDQMTPSVAMDTAGNYVIVWSSFLEDGDDFGVYGQGFSNGGALDGAQFLISQTISGSAGQSYPDVAMNAAGGFVTVWNSFNEDGDPLTQGIYGRRYTGAAAPAASDFRVNSSSTGNQLHPKVASDQAGNFTVVWMDDNADGDEFGIYRKRINNIGANLEGDRFVR